MENKISACILGGNGFIAHHLARRLRQEGYWVRTVDIKEYEYGQPDYTDDYVIGDLRDISVMRKVLIGPQHTFDLIVNCSALMGGALTIFTGENDAQILHDNLLISINCAEVCASYGVGKVYVSSSACGYSQLYQEKTEDVALNENMMYPAFPDSDYGWAKMMEERIFQAYNRNHGLNIRIGRFHNVMGIEGQFDNKKAKAPAALAYKVAVAKDGDLIEVLGDGLQTRSFIGINDAVEGILRLINSDHIEPINIGSDEMVTINQLAQMLIEISGKDLKIKNIPTNAQGVRGRNSDNTKIVEVLGWKATTPLYKNLQELYPWIDAQVKGQK